MFDEDKEISILAYNLETVLAEKLETILVRSILNTRTRDYYDVYILWNFQRKNIEMKILKKALQETAKKRNSTTVIKNHEIIIKEISQDINMQKQWGIYKNKFSYASKIEFSHVCNVTRGILEEIFND